MYNTLYSKMTDTKNLLGLHKCNVCKAQTLLATCINCIKDLEPSKKSNSINIKSIMDIHKLKVIKYSKNPCATTGQKKKGTFNWATVGPDTKIDEKFLEKNNWGIICNKANGIIGVDLDCYNWHPEHGCHKSTAFYDKFGKDYIKKFNTYTQKTPSGGIHLIFQYDNDLNQIASSKNSKFGKGIDIRNGHNDDIATGGYLVGAGSVYKKKDGTLAKYELILDNKPQKMPKELKEWLLDNIYTAEENIKNQNKKIKKDYNIELHEATNQYEYMIEDKKLEKILEKLPKTYFTEHDDWLKFTSAMKVLNKPDIWHKFSKLYGKGKYDFNGNNKVWNSIKLGSSKYPNSLFVEHIFSKCKELDIINYIKFKKIPSNEYKPDKIIERKKLSQMNDEDKNYLSLDLTKLNKGIVIKSDTATGKTTLMQRELLRSENKFISIVSRVSLGKEQYNNFNKAGINCKFYLNHWAQRGDSMITTIDSLPSLYNILGDIAEYTIFIDEFNSVLEYVFQADTCLSKNRDKCWQMLEYVIKNCKNFICVDADISDIAIDYLKDMNRSYEYYQNKYKHNKGVVAYEEKDLDKFIKRISSLDSYIVACDSKKAAEWLWLETGKEAKLLTGSTDKLEDETLDDHQKIIFSPAIIYGLDSILNREVFCYYKEHTISPTNMLQQIARCRDIKQLNYLFQKKKFNEPQYLNYEDCKEKIKEREEYAFNQFNPLTPEEKERQELFNKLYIKYIYKMDCFNTNKYCHTKKLLEDRGFILKSVIYEPANKIDNDKIKEQVDTWKEEDLDLDSDYIKDFNEKYLDNLTKTQLTEIKQLFIDDGLLHNFFTIKKYIEQGLKNCPLYDAKKEYQKVKDEEWAREITEDQLATYYDYNETYRKLSDKEEMNLKKIDQATFKFYLIDKLKVISDFKETKTEEQNNIIKARKVPTEKEQKDFIQAFKFAYNYRGKKEPSISTEYECEKMLYKLMKHSLPSDCFNDPKKIRIDKKNTKYEYSFNKDAESFNLARKVINFQRVNKFKKEIKDEIKLRLYKDDLNELL